MSYNARWTYSQPKHCIEEAEKRATRYAPAPLGFCYRFSEASYSQSSGWGDDEYTTVTYIELQAFPIIRFTPKGQTIYTGDGPRFVSDYTNKRFALPTVKEALESYIKRKERQRDIYRGKADRAENLRIQAEASLAHL